MCMRVQAQMETRAVREELEKELEAHKGTQRRLELLEKEAKSSNLMSMELEDYQRSIQALEGELALREKRLEQVQNDAQLQQETLQHVRKDVGEDFVAWP